jgi:hypothetical protein
MIENILTTTNFLRWKLLPLFFEVRSREGQGQGIFWGWDELQTFIAKVLHAHDSYTTSYH